MLGEYIPTLLLAVYQLTREIASSSAHSVWGFTSAKTVGS